MTNLINSNKDSLLTDKVHHNSPNITNEKNKDVDENDTSNVAEIPDETPYM